MEYVQLGGTDLRISRVGFGCAPIGGHDYGAVDDRTSLGALHRAFELGINFFDAADVYGFGRAETLLGTAFAGKLDRVVIATKVGVRWDQNGRTWRDLSITWLEKALEASMRRLGADFIPLYQVHWPDPATPIGVAIATLGEFRAAGKIGHIGCCNLGKAELDEAVRAGPVESLQLPLSLMDRTRLELVKHSATNHGLSVLCYDVLARGLLTGKYSKAHRFEGNDTRKGSEYFRADRMAEGLEVVARLKSVGSIHGCTPPQIAVRWAMDQAGVSVALTGIKTPAQAEENALSAQCMLAPDELKYLETGRT
jgi:aryl-alcohol dehydrogenase-like predicted oxidoreductase